MFAEALLILVLRLASMALITIRTILVGKRVKTLSAFIGIFESITFIVAVGLVVSELDKPLNLTANSLGFAAGTLAGMRIERAMGVGTATVHAFSRHSAEVRRILNQNGFAVTALAGQGRSGPVDVLVSVVPQREVARVIAIVDAVDAEAFVNWDDTDSVSQRWVRFPTV